MPGDDSSASRSFFKTFALKNPTWLKILEETRFVFGQIKKIQFGGDITSISPANHLNIS
jgi:hypothetical protein